MWLNGTQGYAEEADTLVVRYERAAFSEVHRPILDMIPAAPARVLDIGSGTGRDAAALAAMGHRVVAAEPTDAFREAAMALHPSPSIRWVDDGLPELGAVRAMDERFDLIMLTAVWMHLEEAERRLAMPQIVALLRDEGILIMTLRHGVVPQGRRMFAVTGDETIALAQAQGLTLKYRELTESPPNSPNYRAGITWTRLAFTKPLRG
ncbi:class I SAM-dependent methyltransferase [Pelagibacterium halotolerans]|uniref:class I SAM-dependent methyltransferase n=1 Tax=Pelagibacterium halotolerans TaxID=531813 RepID=UPI00384AF07F